MDFTPARFKAFCKAFFYIIHAILNYIIHAILNFLQKFDDMNALIGLPRNLESVSCSTPGA